MGKIILIIFYFGKFPNYFSLFLDSCKRNTNITWRIYTDNEQIETWPQNVEYIHMTFNECKELFQHKFPFEISLNSPKKLCDFKPAYGFILEEELKEYEFWGHCDLDVIFGDLEKVLQPEIINRHDKLYTLGHLTIYRNVPKVNQYFMNVRDELKSYQTVFQNLEMVGFDEWGAGNINEIFEKSDFRFLKEAPGADIWPERSNFVLSWFDKEKGKYAPEKTGNGIFQIKDGKIFFCQKEKNELVLREFPYVHLQKRKFSVTANCGENYFILPKKIQKSGMSVEDALWKNSRTYILDKQYLKIKFGNILRRIRMRNFKL